MPDHDITWHYPPRRPALIESHPRFEMRPFARKTRKVLRNHLDEMSQIRDDPKLRARIVEEIVGGSRESVPVVYRADWDTRAESAWRRVNELMTMDAIDLMVLLLEVKL